MNDNHSTGDGEYWLGVSDAVRKLVSLMRDNSEGITTEERVMLDEADRMVGQMQVSLRSRMRAAHLGAKPCPECSGDACAASVTDFDTSIPVIRCQVCGFEMDPACLGVTEKVLPRGKYEQVEAALVKAWNARYDASIRREKDEGNMLRVEVDGSGSELL